MKTHLFVILATVGFSAAVSFAADNDWDQTLRNLDTKVYGMEDDRTASQTKQDDLAERMERSYMTRQRVFNTLDIDAALADINAMKTKTSPLFSDLRALGSKQGLVKNETTYQNARSLSDQTSEMCDDLEALLETTKETQNYAQRIRVELGSTPTIYITNGESENIRAIKNAAELMHSQCDEVAYVVEDIVERAKP